MRDQIGGLVIKSSRCGYCPVTLLLYAASPVRVGGQDE
jgi:hypothetical protein